MACVECLHSAVFRGAGFFTKEPCFSQRAELSQLGCALTWPTNWATESPEHCKPTERPHDPWGPLVCHILATAHLSASFLPFHWDVCQLVHPQSSPSSATLHAVLRVLLFWHLLLLFDFGCSAKNGTYPLPLPSGIHFRSQKFTFLPFGLHVMSGQVCLCLNCA